MKLRNTVITLLFSSLAASALGESAAEKGKQGSDTIPNPRLQPFNTDVTRLPKGFMGVDLASMLTALGKYEEPTKSEFETSAEYSVRRKRWESKPIAGKLYPDSPIAILLPMEDRNFSYSADAESMSASFSHDILCGHKQKGLLLAVVHKSLGSYVGQNGFGAKTVVTRSHSEILCLMGVDEKTFEFPVPRKKAVDARYLSGILIVGTLSKPYISTSSDYKKPTMDSPREITSRNVQINFVPQQYWVFNRSTGEIYLKQIDPVTQTLETEKRRSSPDCDGGDRGVGSWVDGTTGAVRTIYADGSQWKMKVCIPGASISTRALSKLDGGMAFEWLEKGRPTGNVYRIEDDGALSIHDNGRYVETMNAVGQ